ncbi:MAG: ABC transporter permease subunit, partial [Acidobacteria bacterium]|nr:ABC transporter permease subunit [Acidobacteriota bacterium]
MLRSVFTKTIWERRWGMVGWILGGFAIAGVIVALYPIIRDSADLIELIEQLPEQFIALAGIDPEIFTTGYGFLQAQMYSLLGPLLILILAIGFGSSATAAEESNGTADLLLATPVTRSRVVVDKSLAMVVLVAVLVLTFAVVLLIGNLVVDLQMSIWGVLGGNLGLLLLGLFFGSLAMMISAWSGKRVLGTGIAGGAAALTFLLDSFGPLVEGLGAIQPLLPFYWYSNGSPLLNGPTWWHLLLLGGAVLFTGVGVALFRSRDIGVFATLRLFPARGNRRERAIASSMSPLLASITGKGIWDRRRSFWWWLLGIGFLAAITISLFPSLADTGDAFQGLLDAYPPELLAFFGITDPDSLLTGAGLVSSRVYQGIGLVVFLAFAIGIGKAALAGEEKDGTADLLLATPPTRDRVVVAKATSLLLLLLALVAGVFVIVWLGDAIVDLDLTLGGLLAANLGMAFLAFLFGAVALATGAGTGKPGLAIGVASGLGVATFLLNGFGAVVA